MTNTPATINFSNAFQAAAGLEVSAKQFLECEGASCLAFQCAVSTALDEGTGNPADLKNLAAEKAKAEHAARNTAAADLERLTRDFLRAIWIDGTDPDEWLAATAKAAANPEIIRLVGKAADAIEGRCGCRWGSGTTDSHGFAALVDAIGGCDAVEVDRRDHHDSTDYGPCSYTQVTLCAAPDGPCDEIYNSGYVPEYFCKGCNSVKTECIFDIN